MTISHHRVIPLYTCIVLFLFAGAAQSAICDATQGSITRGQYRSLIAETNMYFSVYTPPCYDQETRTYPALYLMHGSNEDDGQWGRLGIQEHLDRGITDGTLPPMIVVMPFGEWIANQNQFDRVSWENVFLEELLPLVESSYRIDPRREARAIGGISRGGFWAFELAFRHPDRFSAVGGHSAFFAEGNAPPDYDPLKLALNAPDLDTLAIWLDRGAQDYAAPGLDLMRERLTTRGIPHQYTIFPEGQHANSYWRQHVLTYLQFYAASWADQVPAPTLTPVPLIFATNTPFLTATPIPAASYDLFVPAVAFPSLQTGIMTQTLMDIRTGQAVPKLALSESAAARLNAYGMWTNGITTVADDALLNTLWRDRSLFTLLPFDQLTPRYRMLTVDGTLPIDLDLATYPLAFSSATPNYQPDQLTRIMASGVTALTRVTRETINRNGVTWAGEALRPYVEQVDFFHTSNEVSFSPLCPQADGEQLGAFCSKEAHFSLLTDLGLDIVELSGNHNLDFGSENYLTTLEWYRERNILTVGGGETLKQARQPLTLEHHGNRIIWLSCNAVGPYYALAEADTPGAADCDWGWLRTALPELDAASDVLIVSVQYLEVEDYQPLPQQVSDFRGLADLGADVVLGTQAHKPQTYEFYTGRGGKPTFIHYGLGNLFFDQPFWGNMRFFMDQLLIYQGRLLTVDVFTGIIDDNARPRPMTAEEQLNFLAFMFNTQGRF